MSSTVFSKPTISSIAEKPIPLANQGYPYNNIASDRRFEELIYSIHRKKIENNPTWKNLYDDIDLMQGVGEQGRDSVLYKDKVITGVIQCKKYSTRISKPECIKEILKLVMYSFFDNSILPDENNFTYYFVASGGFSGPASEYLDKFNEEIAKEAELEKWFNELKEQYKASLGALDYQAIRMTLHKKLSAIKILKVVPQDLDLELSTPYTQEIIPLFFDVRTVTDNSGVQEIKNLLETQLSNDLSANITDDEIVRQFATASLQLSSYRDYLYNYTDTHIQRDETTEILNWIENPLQPKNAPLLVLAGNPGLGKTVILKDVLSALVAKQIPAIAIKADRYYAQSIPELTQKLNLERPLAKLIEKLKLKHEKIVVIIDQIDSLSQSVTSRRDYIDTYNQLIHELKLISGIRIVISIRTFDLNYDYEFSGYKALHKITTKPLSEKQLSTVLGKLGLSIDKLSPGFITLLSIPNHLDIFCKIHNPGLSLNLLHSIQDLYNELWKQKISNLTQHKADDCKKALFSLSDKMYSLQRLSVPESEIDDLLKSNLIYLTSNGLLIEENKSVQFFHQSFYDYIFARAFVEKGASLEDYINKENQTIYIRSAMKMILAFLRQKDNGIYIETISKFLFPKPLRLHLQLLIINQLGFEQNPSVQEIEFLRTKILKSQKYFLPFLESAIGSNWLPVLIEEKSLDKLINPVPTISEKIGKNPTAQNILGRIGLSRWIKPTQFENRREKFLTLWFWVLRRYLPESRKPVLEYLNTLPESEDRDFKVLRIMHSLKKWDEPLSFTLFEKCTTNPEKSWYDILSHLEEALDYNYEWSVDQINKLFFIKADKEQGAGSSMYEHNMGNCLKKMFALNAGKAFQFSVKHITTLVNDSAGKIEVDTSKLFYDGVYDMYDFDRDHIHNTKELLYQLSLDNVVVLAKENSPVFKDFIVSNLNQNSLTVLKIVLTGLEAAPAYNTASIFDLLKILLAKKAHDNSLQYFLTKLIRAAYPFFNATQKEELNKLLLTLTSEYDFRIYEVDGKKNRVSYYGKTRFEFLSAIPENELHNNTELKKHFLELQRRFGKAENKKPRGVRLMRVGPPLADQAYEKMNLDQWEDSFIKFDRDGRPSFGSDLGGLTENYRKFEEKVPGKASFFLPLIEKIITENKVAPDYMLAGMNGLIKANYQAEKILHLLKKMMQLPIQDFHVRQLIWQCDYLIKSRLIDNEILTYLCKVAAQDPNPVKPTNPDNPEFDTLNTNRGAAVNALIKCFYHKEFGDKIFATLLQVAQDPIASVKISALRDMAVLMNINKDKTLELFLAFMENTEDPHIYHASINTAQYLARYNFEALIPYFKKAITIDKVKDQMAIILAIAWLNDKPGSYSLLEEVWKTSQKAKANMIHVSTKNYVGADELVKEKCRALFSLFLNETASEIIHQYNTVFLHMSPLHFADYLPLIKNFSTSKAAGLEPHYYYEYLIKCCKRNPREIIDLIIHYKEYKEPNSATGPYYSPGDPVKVLVGALNGLYDHVPVDKEYATKAMNLFDEMLSSQLLRSDAQTVLDTI